VYMLGRLQGLPEYVGTGAAPAQEVVSDSDASCAHWNFSSPNCLLLVVDSSPRRILAGPARGLLYIFQKKINNLSIKSTKTQLMAYLTFY